MTDTSITPTAPGALERTSALGICLAAAIAVVYCLWTLNRGFEITDEAYYLLLSMDPSAQTLYISAQHWVMSWLWQATGSLVWFRASGLLILMGTALLLAQGVLQFCYRTQMEMPSYVPSVTMAASVVAALLYAYTINLSPSYNLLASAGAYAAAGFVLLATSNRHPILSALSCILAGGALGVEVLCKASAGISTGLIVLVWILVFSRTHWQRLLGVIAVMTGVAGLGWLALVTNTTWEAANEAVTQGLELFRIVQSEPVHTRLVRYGMQFGKHLMMTGLYYAAPMILIAIYVRTRRRIFFWLGMTALSLTLALSGQFLGGWNSDLSLTPPYPIVALLIMLLILTAGRWMLDRRMTILLAGLLALPYSVAMGTGNTLFTQVVVSMAPWGALFTILATARGKDPVRSQLPAMMIVLCFAMTVALQIITSGLRPYQIAKPLFQQTDRFETGNIGPVYVDGATHRFLTALKQATERCAIAQGTAFLGLYNIPGVALALQVQPLMSPWLNNAEQARFVLDRVEPSALRDVVIGLNKGAADQMPALPTQLQGFPAGYRKCGSATYPFGPQQIEIWQRQQELELSSQAKY